MSNYPNQSSDPIVTNYEKYEIAIRTSTHAWGHLTDQVSASYEITKDGEAVAKSSVPDGFGTPTEAAANALRIAKLDIFEHFDGPDPAEE